MLCCCKRRLPSETDKPQQIEPVASAAADTAHTASAATDTAHTASAATDATKTKETTPSGNIENSVSYNTVQNMSSPHVNVVQVGAGDVVQNGKHDKNPSDPKQSEGIERDRSVDIDGALELSEIEPVVMPSNTCETRNETSNHVGETKEISFNSSGKSGRDIGAPEPISGQDIGTPEQMSKLASLVSRLESIVMMSDGVKIQNGSELARESNDVRLIDKLTALTTRLEIVAQQLDK